MIKGITKNIIEINPRNHDYFEKLIVILKNTPDIPTEEEISENAFLLAGQKPPAFINRKPDNFKNILYLLIGAVSALLCSAVTLLFV